VTLRQEHAALPWFSFLAHIDENESQEKRKAG
jgi:hypothetical protein